MEPLVRHLECDAEDEVAAAHRGLMGLACREIRTKGDGACAVHAAFGVGIPGDVHLQCCAPRQCLREVLGCSLATIRARVRPAMRQLVESVVTSVWSDFVVPYVGPHAPHAPGEEGMFLARLFQASSLWEAVLWQLEGNRVRQQQRDDLVANCQLRSATVFRPDLAEELWRPLGIQSGLLPAGEDVHPQGEEWDFLQAPWEYRKGRCVVRGCDAPFRADASGGPVSKFAALFDARPEFAGLRFSFLKATCGVDMQELQAALDIASREIPLKDQVDTSSFDWKVDSAILRLNISVETSPTDI